MPASEIEENIALYTELVSLRPEDAKYHSNLEHYQTAKEKEDKKTAARYAKLGDPSRLSGWDGTYPAVTSYLKEYVNDPGSIDVSGCTKLYHTKKGWLVGFTYRGKNAFGALIKSSNWFTIRHGRVVEMHDADAYNP